MPETTAPAPSRIARPSLELLDHLVEEVETVFHGKKEVVRLALACVLARGHVLFEDGGLVEEGEEGGDDQRPQREHDPAAWKRA